MGHALFQLAQVSARGIRLVHKIRRTLPGFALLPPGDTADETTKLSLKARDEFPNCVFFTSKLVFERENWFIRQLRNQTALAMHSRLHLQGVQMVILPMKV